MTANLNNGGLRGLLSPAAEAHLQFQVRLKLAKYGIQPPGRVSLKSKCFVHPSEEESAAPILTKI